jgi:hypothetical protein
MPRRRCDQEGFEMANTVTVVLAHGAWADGSSWSKVIAGLRRAGVASLAAPLPLTSLADDVAALDRTLERAQGPVVLVGHAYAGAVIGATRSSKAQALVYVAALAPDEGETVADVFYRTAPHPQAPQLAPDDHGLIWLPQDAFASAFAPDATAEEQAVLHAIQRPISAGLHHGSRPSPTLEGPAELVPGRRERPDDRARDPGLHGRADGRIDPPPAGGPYAQRHGAGRRHRPHPRGHPGRLTRRNTPNRNRYCQVKLVNKNLRRLP